MQISSLKRMGYFIKPEQVWAYYLVIHSEMMREQVLSTLLVARPDFHTYRGMDLPPQAPVTPLPSLV